MNVSNTFFPFWLYTFHPDSPWVTSVDGRSGPLVRFAFGWWNTLPLGLGLLTFVLSIAALARAVRTHVSALLLLVVLPALLLIVYWGSYAAGLMRECGHPLFAAWIGVACVALSRVPGRLASFVAHPILPWLRLPEILLMLWLTTFANAARARADLDPFYLTMSTIALCGAAWVLSRGAAARAGGRLADDTLTPQS
jgi:hypothetical protein